MTTRTAAKGPGANGAGPSRVIDLDQVEIAAAEADLQPVTLRFSGTDFTLPAEMPAAFALYASAGRLFEALEALLGKDQMTAFLDLNPGMRHIEALAEKAGEVYGVTPGEAPASPNS